METEQGLELERFLTDNGYANLVTSFTSQDVTTLVAAKDLTLDDLKEHIGCAPLVAKKLFAKLHPEEGNGGSQQPLGMDPNQGAIVPVQQQMQMMQFTFETNQKLNDMEIQMKLMQMENKHAAEIAELKHERTVAELQKDMKHEAVKRELEMAKMKVEYEGKMALAEEKALSKPADLPWDPIFPYGRYAFPAGSNLLTPHFFHVIQSWLGSPRHWESRYRASRDGYASADFHRCCDNIGSTITIISANGYLFGGYTPASWNTSSSYVSVGGSFLFTLTNAFSKPPTVFHQKNTSHSIYCHPSYGPTFGSGHDIRITSNSNSNSSSYSSFPSTYNDTLGHGNSTFAGSRTFTVSEIEVFRLL